MFSGCVSLSSKCNRRYSFVAFVKSPSMLTGYHLIEERVSRRHRKGGSKSSSRDDSEGVGESGSGVSLVSSSMRMRCRLRKLVFCIFPQVSRLNAVCSQVISFVRSWPLRVVIRKHVKANANTHVDVDVSSRESISHSMFRYRLLQRLRHDIDDIDCRSNHRTLTEVRTC